MLLKLFVASEDGSDLNVGEMQIDGNVLSTRISKKSSCEVVADENVGFLMLMSFLFTVAIVILA